MANRWRVGEGGLRVLNGRGSYSLPAGAILDEIPQRYEGTLEVVEWGELLDRPIFRKRLAGYEDKMLRSAEDKCYRPKGHEGAHGEPLDVAEDEDRILYGRCGAAPPRGSMRAGGRR